VIGGLTVSPADLVATGHNHVTIRFTLTQDADVSVSIVSAGGKVAREIPKPGRRAGQVTVSYYGYNGSGHRLAAGQYDIVVVAKNSDGTSTAEVPLTISSP
jgi:flagellar hook assembly protein FlgD